MSDVQTLDRALAILHLFGPDRPEWGSAEVARELGLSLPTTSRLMRALEGNRLLLRVDSRRFRLGFGLVELGSTALHCIEVRERLHPVLIDLARDSGATAVLGVMTEARDAARVVDRVEGSQHIRVALDIGHGWPLHAGALAKALLAHLPDQEQIIQRGLMKVGKNTITTPARMRAELDLIRTRGWAVSSEETEVGAWGVAKAILDRNHEPVAAILLMATLDRQNDDFEQDLANRVTRGVHDAAKRLGLSSPAD